MKGRNSWRRPGEWRIFRSDDRLLLILIGIIVGICSGMAALVLSNGLVTLLTWLAPYRARWWAFILPGLGAALSSLFLNQMIREGAGHGVPEVIYSVSRYGGLIRLRSCYSRIVSSCLTIGFGGSAGPEAPVVMSGAAIGSNIARFFSFNDRQRTTLVGCGSAGAIAAIFNAPIAGLVFTVEVILGEWRAMSIVPIAISAVAGAEVSRVLRGNHIAFDHRLFDIGHMDLLASFGLAVATATASVVLTGALRHMHHLAGRLRVAHWIRAALGGFAVGAIGIWVPVVLGEGYHAIQEMIGNVFHSGFLFAFLATLLKILATALTLGWGGSGGIFAPSLVIGSLTGLSYHRLLALLWPNAAWVDEGCFALLGMAGLISGILQAPLTGIFLIVEITGDYGVILPLIIVSAVSSTFCQYVEPASFYLKELIERGQLLRPGTDARVLSDLRIQELLEKDCLRVRPDMRLREFIEIVKQSRRNHFPVEDPRTGVFLGMVDIKDVRPYLFTPMMHDAVVVEQIMAPKRVFVELDDDLNRVLRLMDEEGLFTIPVLFNRRFVGMVSKATLLDRYRQELRVQSGP